MAHQLRFLQCQLKKYTAIIQYSLVNFQFNNSYPKIEHSGADFLKNASSNQKLILASKKFMMMQEFMTAGNR